MVFVIYVPTTDIPTVYTDIYIYISVDTSPTSSSSSGQISLIMLIVLLILPLLDDLPCVHTNHF